MRWKQFGNWHERRSSNKAMVKSQCVPIIVTPDDLIRAVDEDGVKDYSARDLVEALIERARVTALAQTLGVSVPV